MRSLIIAVFISVACGAMAQPVVRTNEMLMQTKGDNQTAIAIYVQTNQTLPFLDFWFGATNVFQVSSSGAIMAGTNTLSSVGIQHGVSITSSDGTVTNNFPNTYTMLPAVTVTQLGATNSTTNVVTSLTTSNFVWKGGGPNISNMWISAGN